jgi:hypothetical protein
MRLPRTTVFVIAGAALCGVICATPTLLNAQTSLAASRADTVKLKIPQRTLQYTSPLTRKILQMAGATISYRVDLKDASNDGLRKSARESLQKQPLMVVVEMSRDDYRKIPIDDQMKLRNCDDDAESRTESLLTSCQTELGEYKATYGERSKRIRKTPD